MSFYGDRFIFDGIPCEEFGLILYDVGSSKQDATGFASDSEFSEDRIARRYDPLFYGVSQNGQLSFSLVFGLNPQMINENVSFDRWDFEKIASWLTGRDGYKWLEIGDDAECYYRYRCRISNLKVVQAGIYPQVFTCTVTCDSPFAYLPTQTYEYQYDGESKLIFHNRSTYNGFYYPKLEIELKGSKAFAIINSSDNNRKFEFNNIPTAYASATVLVDNQNQVITSSNGDNLYPCFNKRYFRLVRGDNDLLVSGTGVLRIICDFPVNVGG